MFAAASTRLSFCISQHLRSSQHHITLIRISIFCLLKHAELQWRGEAECSGQKTGEEDEGEDKTKTKIARIVKRIVKRARKRRARSECKRAKREELHALRGKEWKRVEASGKSGK